jgi:hypothetical protein
LINGAHAILYSDDADATRAALVMVLGTRSVDAGGGWLIFALPPAELAVHPASEGAAGPSCISCATASPPRSRPSRPREPTAITLPGGVELGLYEPRHPTAAQPG